MQQFSLIFMATNQILKIFRNFGGHKFFSKFTAMTKYSANWDI